MCMEAAGRSREDSLPLLLPPSIEPIALCGLCCATANDNLQNLFQFPISFCCSFIGKWRISYLETLSVPIDLLANTQVYFHDWKSPTLTRSSDQIISGTPSLTRSSITWWTPSSEGGQSHRFGRHHRASLKHRPQSVRSRARRKPSQESSPAEA